MLHCYSVMKLEGEHETYFRILYPFALWLGETGVPGFFFISGYLFFMSKKDYTQKIGTRLHTLVIPYLLWNLLLIILYIIAYQIGYPQDINGRSLGDYQITDYLRLFWDRGSFDNGNFVPLLCPLWYIRNLFMMCVISPFLYYIIRYAREAFLVVIAIWWLMSYHNAFIPQTILFYSLGAYFSIFDSNPLKIVLNHWGIFLTLFLQFAISDIAIHSGGYWTPINLQTHRLSLIFNIPVILIIADFCHQKGWENKVLPNSAFIVFCAHYPIVVLLRKLCVSQFAKAPDLTHILLYYVCIIIAILLSLMLYMLLDRFFPKTKRILSGNR